MYIIRNKLRCFSSEIFGVAECEIIHLVNCEISHFVRCEMKFAFSHLRSKYFTAELFHLPARANFVEKSTHCLGRQMCAFFWWAIGDSNPGPTGYEPVALTN